MNLNFLSTSASGWSSWCLCMVFSLSVLWLTARLIVWSLRRGSAALKHRVWALSVLASLLLPIAVSWLPKVELGWSHARAANLDRVAENTSAIADPLPPAAVSPSARFEISQAETQPELSSKLATSAAPATVGVMPGKSSAAVADKLVRSGKGSINWWWVAFAVPAFLGLCQMARALQAARRVVSQSAMIHDVECQQVLRVVCDQMHWRGAVALREAGSADVPMCVGWWQSSIVLPGDWDRWSAATLQAVLTHEMSHVVRRDVAWQLLARLTCAVYWFHPLAWFAAWRMRVERETACDDRVLSTGESPTVYARVLVELAERSSRPTRVPALAVAMTGRSELEQRVRAVLASGRSRQAVGPWSGRILLVAMIGLIIIAGGLSPHSSRVVTASEDAPKTVVTTQPSPTADDSKLEKQPTPKPVAKPVQATVTGIITDANGQPVAEATIANPGRELGSKTQTTSNQQGAFTLTNLQQGYAGLEIVVRKRGFAPVRQALKVGTDGVLMPVAIKLERGHAIRGRIESIDGKPIADAKVWANGLGSPVDPIDRVTTDSDGIFEFDSLPAPSQFSVFATNFSYAMNFELPLDSNALVIVKLNPLGVIRGRVIDADSQQPVTGFNVRATTSRVRKPEDPKNTSAWGVREKLVSPGYSFRTAEGQFQIKELTHGMPVEVIVDAPGYQRTIVPRIVARAEADSVSVDISLKKSSTTKSASLSGQVVNHLKQPVPDAELRLVVTSEPSEGISDNKFNWALIKSEQLARKSYVDEYRSQMTDAEGRFAFPDLEEGKYLQLIYFGTKVPKGRILELAQTKSGMPQTVTIEPPEPARIKGSFDPALVSNAGDIRLSLREEAFHDYEFKLEKGQTNFDFPMLPPGEYDVSIMSLPVRDASEPGTFTLYPLANRRLKVDAGQTHEVKFSKDDLIPQRDTK